MARTMSRIAAIVVIAALLVPTALASESAGPSLSEKIKNVVVLMLENRSFVRGLLRTVPRCSSARYTARGPDCGR